MLTIRDNQLHHPAIHVKIVANLADSSLICHDGVPVCGLTMPTTPEQGKTSEPTRHIINTRIRIFIGEGQS